MKWKWILYGKDGVAEEIEIDDDDDFPNVVIYRGRIYYYNERSGELVEAKVLRIDE